MTTIEEAEAIALAMPLDSGGSRLVLAIRENDDKVIVQTQAREFYVDGDVNFMQFVENVVIDKSTGHVEIRPITDREILAAAVVREYYPRGEKHVNTREEQAEALEALARLPKGENKRRRKA